MMKVLAQSILVILKNILANCKICYSQTDWLNINNYYKIEFATLISNFVAGENFA